MDPSARGLAGPFLNIISQQRPLAWRLGFAALTLAAAFTLRYALGLL